jgi:hypothetical protein
MDRSSGPGTFVGRRKKRRVLAPAGSCETYPKGQVHPSKSERERAVESMSVACSTVH